MYGRHLNVSMYKQSGLFNDREGQKLCVCVENPYQRRIITQSRNMFLSKHMVERDFCNAL